ncbi:AAA family ATPase [Prochlorococcus sp. MIT 1306]|nr:AAA family ATPase [Prochlorococcus sp. MIT 1306]KZR63160.1 CobQ/CobB/MinD/ParA nucleotide binding domain protein [Prochlorococcus sp. MIT 1306]
MAHLEFEDSYEFEKHVARQCEELGYEVVMPPKNQPGYDIEIIKGKERIAVQVKCYKAKSPIAVLNRFMDFLELPIAASFTSGWLITQSGFGKPSMTLVETERPSNLMLGVSTGKTINWKYDPEGKLSHNNESDEEPSHAKEEDGGTKYFGVFTCKGGVGKTTVAAHLAGAFALMGFDVILLDLDPDKNLRKLFLEDPSSDDNEGPASLYVPPHKRDKMGSTITVLNADQWNERAYPEVKVVICDCSPVLNQNPDHLVEKFDYCVLPTTLNPLGIAKGGDVITRTFAHIRKKNKKAEMFAVVNSYNSAQSYERQNSTLLSMLEKSISQYSQTDPKCQLIHPSYAKIRQSKLLQYWGMHIIDGSPPALAFREVAGRNYPRTDFLQLAGFLQDHTSIMSISELKQ